MADKPTFASLPPETLLHIIRSTLPPLSQELQPRYDALRILSLVHSDWRPLAQAELRRHVLLNSKSPWETDAESQANGAGPRSVIVPKDTELETVLTFLKRYGERLVHVTIDDVSSDEGIGKAALFQALAELPRLHSLRLTTFTLGGLPTFDPSLVYTFDPSLVYTFPSLRTLSLGAARQQLDKIDLTFLTTWRFPLLRTLNIALYLHQRFTAQLSDILEILGPNLEEVSLSTTFTNAIPALRLALLKHLPNVRSFGFDLNLKDLKIVLEDLRAKGTELDVLRLPWNADHPSMRPPKFDEVLALLEHFSSSPSSATMPFRRVVCTRAVLEEDDEGERKLQEWAEREGVELLVMRKPEYFAEWNSWESLE